MTREEINRAFVTLGWIHHRDEVGDSVIAKMIGNKTVTVLPIRNSLSLYLGTSLSIYAFDIADAIVSGVYSPVVESSIIFQTQIRLRKEDITADDIGSLSIQMLEWASNQDVSAGLANLRALPTSCLGAMPARHLAALAVDGNMETLTYYRDSFSNGDRLDFVPYVDIEMIERALDFAQQRHINPEWLPATPRLRI